MKFNEFAKYLNRLEETTKRLEMTDILSELIRDLDKEDIDIGVYLASGYLYAPFNNIKFNIADKMMIRIIMEAYNVEESNVMDMYKKLGDLGNVAFELAKFEDTNLTISAIHKSLVEVAKTEGTGSQELKIKKTSKLLSKVDKLSAKYIVRIILGTTRLGFTELTIVNALAIYLGDKKYKKEIESVYNIHPDIGKIAKALKEKGMEGLEDINIEPGTPLLLQRAQRVKSFEEVLERMDETWLEYKLDGTRVQLHMDKDIKIEKDNDSLFSSSEYLLKTYTRNLEETTHMYPDIIEGAKKQIKANSVILDGEAIGYDPKTGEFLPFQETIQRKRKHGVSDAVKNIPLKYFVFDILYLDGKSLEDKTLIERKDILNKVVGKGDVLELVKHIEVKDMDHLYSYFKDAKEKGLEGLIAKNPKDKYQAGARSYSWVKLKVADEKLLDDSIDCVVLGYYFGKGTRAKFGIGGLLLGIYDEENDVFKTISKLGTGLTEEGLEDIKKLCDKQSTGEKPNNVEMNKTFTPDVFVKPSIILEIGSDEITKSPSHSAGYALRFPRLLKVRTDKKATDSTTLKEIKDMYN